LTTYAPTSPRLSGSFGNQIPSHCSVPRSAVSLGDKAVQFAARAGLFLDPWQQDVLRGSLGVTPDGRWAARNVGLLVPRQNGKGSVLEARELFELFGMQGRKTLIVHSAHKFDTSQEHFGRMRTLIEGNPDLDRHIQAILTGAGREAIVLKNGSRLKFKARTISGSGRGFSSDLLILDEAIHLPEQALSSMLPTLVTRPNPQVWYTSSAGMPDSDALWRVVKRGRLGAEGMAYWEWGCPVGTDPEDRSAWADANPGLGYRVSMDLLEDDFAFMSPDDFSREHLGVWDEVAEASLIHLDQWRSLEDPDPVDEVSVFAVEVSMDRAFATVVSAGVVRGSQPTGPLAERLASTTGFKVDGRDVPLTDALSSVMGDGVRVAVQRRDRGTSWVVDECLRLESGCSPAGFVVDSGGPAGSLISDMEAAGLVVLPMSTGEVARACAWLVDAVQAGAVLHGPDRDLDLAVANVVPRPIGDGAFAFGRKASTGADVTPLNGCAFAAWGHNEFGVIDPSAFVL
jgi:hypothetical protein